MRINDKKQPVAMTLKSFGQAFSKACGVKGNVINLRKKPV